MSARNADNETPLRVAVFDRAVFGIDVSRATMIKLGSRMSDERVVSIRKRWLSSTSNGAICREARGALRVVRERDAEISAAIRKILHERDCKLEVVRLYLAP